MTVRRIIKLFRFDEENRSRITLDDGVRLDPKDGRAKLKADSKGKFSTGPSLTVRTWITEPARVIQWLGFESINLLPREACDPVSDTDIQYRLSDGTDDYYWDGAAWTTPVPTDVFNTEGEVATNIGSFLSTVQGRKLQIVANLQTDDANETPELRELKVLYSTDIEFQEDLIARSLIPELREKVRPVTDYVVEIVTPSARIGVGPKGSHPLEAPYNIVGVQAAYDDDADPAHLVDLSPTFDTATLEVVFPATLLAGRVIFLRLVYEPEVEIRSSQDFVEVNKVPALVLESISIVDASELPGAKDSVVNRLTGDAVSVPAPIQGDLEIVLSFWTEKQVDHQRIADALKLFFGNTPSLRSRGLDEEFRLWLRDEYDMSGPPQAEDINRGELTFRIVGGLFFYKDAVDTKAVSALTLRFGEGEEVKVAINEVFFGVAADGVGSEAAILALSGRLQAPARAWDFDVSPGADEFAYCAFPAVLGDAQVFIGGSALPGGMNVVGGTGNTITVNGIPHTLLQSDEDELGPQRFVFR